MIYEDSIREFKVGTVVRERNGSGIGHVVKFAVNTTDDVVIVVQWADHFGTVNVHPNNLVIL